MRRLLGPASAELPFQDQVIEITSLVAGAKEQAKRGTAERPSVGPLGDMHACG